MNIHSVGANSLPATTRSGSGSQMQELLKEYPHLKLGGFGASGKYNVSIHPKILNSMQNDPELAGRVHDMLGNVKKDHDELESRITGMGHKFLGCGTEMQEDGSVSCWVSSSREGASESGRGKTINEALEELREKREEEEEEEKRLEKAAEAKRLMSASSTVSTSVVQDADGETTAQHIDLRV